MSTSIQSSVVGNSFASLSGSILSRALDIVMISLLAHFLGVERFGIFSFALVYVSLFSIFIDLGINSILIREISSNVRDASQLLGNAIVFRGLLSIVVTLVVCGSIFMLNYSSDVQHLVWIASLGILFSFRLPSFKDVYETVFIAKLRIRYSVIAGVLNRLITVLLVSWAIHTRLSPEGLMWIYTISNMPSFFLLIIVSNKLMKPSFNNVNYKLWLQLVKEGFPIAVSGVLFILLSKIDTLLLSVYWTGKEIGYYNAATRLVEPLDFIAGAVMVSAFPLMSNLHSSSESKFKEVFQKASLVLILASIPLMGVLFYMSPLLIKIIYGKGFIPATGALEILSGYLLPVFLWALISQSLIAMRLQESLIWITLIGLLVNLVANFILVPSLSFLGAAISRVLTISIVTSSGYCIMGRRLPSFYHLPALKLSILILAMLLPFFLSMPQNFLTAIFSIIIFLIGVLAMQIVSKEDLRWIVRLRSVGIMEDIK